MADLDHVPKLCGADCELGNFILGRDTRIATAPDAARLLLHAIPDAVTANSTSSWYYGGATTSYGGATAYNRQDWGRKFLKTNGGCAYIDLDHLEICLPEVISAFDHVAAWHALLRITREAQRAANAALPTGQSIQVLVNNSDGRGNAYGSHLNFLITRRAFENLFERKLHHQLWLAAFQASSILYTGAGKVGSENDQPPVDFQISQRADFFETLCGPQTTYNRPIVNCRNEALCGPQSARAVVADDLLARLHVIFFDNTLCHGSSLLKVGTMQIVLAMLEAEEIDSSLILDDPVEAVVAWSHDPDLERRCAMASGRSLPALDVQLYFLEQAARFVARGGCGGLVPRAPEILDLWADTLRKLADRDFEALAPRIDWVLKRHILTRALDRDPGLAWAGRKLLDHIYSSLDVDEGLYWAYERSGLVERYVDDDRIEHFVEHPPTDTRAYARAHLLRQLDPATIQSVDWDRMSIRYNDGSYWPVTRTIAMDNPLAFNQRDTEALFEDGAATSSLVERLNALITSDSRDSRDDNNNNAFKSN